MGSSSSSASTVATPSEDIQSEMLAQLTRPKVQTVCIFGSVDMWENTDYMNWVNDPNSMVFTKKNLYCKGIERCKGPTMAWLFAIRTLIKRRIKMPINLKVIFVFACILKLTL